MNKFTIESIHASLSKYVTIIFLAITLLIVGSAPLFGQSTDNVTVTVTLQNVAVSVSDGAVDYGTLSTSATEDTTSGGVNDSQTATNDGNVNVDLNIRGQDTTNWTLAGTPGADQYTHNFCNNGTCDATPSWTALTTSYATLATTVIASGTQEFDLQIETPTSTSSFTQQSADVTVQAVAS